MKKETPEILSRKRTKTDIINFDILPCYLLEIHLLLPISFRIGSHDCTIGKVCYNVG